MRALRGGVRDGWLDGGVRVRVGARGVYERGGVALVALGVGIDRALYDGPSPGETETKKKKDV